MPARGRLSLVEELNVLLELAAQPEAVQRLRQWILGLALHGRLNGGNPSERLPEHWTRAPVGEIAECVLGKMLDRVKHRTGTPRPYLRNINVRWGAFDLSDLREMFFEDDELTRYGVVAGDVLVCEGGEPGRAAVWFDRTPALIQKAIHRVRPGPKLLPEWMVLNLRLDTWTGRLDEYFTGATIKHFTGKALQAYALRLPPVSEQRRIVRTVNQLMRLCDDLELRLKEREDARARLTQALVAGPAT